jgi:hypothetical protein
VPEAPTATALTSAIQVSESSAVEIGEQLIATYIDVDGDALVSVTINSVCGTAVSAPTSVTFNQVMPPAAENDTVWAVSGSATLTATGSDLTWYDAAIGGNIIGAGTSFTTPVLTSDSTYYVGDAVIYNGDIYQTGKPDNGTSTEGSNFTGNQSLFFTVQSELELVSVKVYARGGKEREFELKDNQGNLLESDSIIIPDGESRINLNWNIPIGADYEYYAPTATVNLSTNLAGVNYPY